MKNSVTKLLGVFSGWKQGANWNDAGFFVYTGIDNNMCTFSGGKLTIKESGKYIIYMSSTNAGDNGGTPRFRLYRNGVIIKEYTNNSSNNNVVKTSITIDLNENDILYGQMYGGGKDGTYFITTFLKISD